MYGFERRFMTSFAIKLIAAVTMFVDHMGLILFPQYKFFRIIGRLAFPLYAYCIAEGFRYTGSRKRYFLRVFILGLLCQVVYTIVERDIYLGILLTFSLSILLMTVQERFLSEWKNGKYVWGAAYLLSVIAVFLLTRIVTVDYGFFGIMLPVVTALFPDKPRRITAFAICLSVLSLDAVYHGNSTQFYSLFALIPLLLYNGKQGKYKLKHFFYIFYPAHLVLLYAIDFLV